MWELKGGKTFLSGFLLVKPSKIENSLFPVQGLFSMHSASGLHQLIEQKSKVIWHSWLARAEDGMASMNFAFFRRSAVSRHEESNSQSQSAIKCDTRNVQN